MMRMAAALFLSLWVHAAVLPVSSHLASPRSLTGLRALGSAKPNSAMGVRHFRQPSELGLMLIRGKQTAMATSRSTSGSACPVEIWLDVRQEPEELLLLMSRLEGFYNSRKPPIRCLLMNELDNSYKALDCYKDTTTIVQDPSDYLLNGERMPIGVVVAPLPTNFATVDTIVRNNYAWILVSDALGTFDDTIGPFTKFVLERAAHCREISGSNTMVAIPCNSLADVPKIIQMLRDSGGAIVLPYDMALLAAVQKGIETSPS
mmetsp:Transcript_26815/g.65055  ORF Transcript_26815/g.65055 Transcript_26815/m.65055 type:complete len:261 (+) Transcript_26815:460-1242(+)